MWAVNLASRVTIKLSRNGIKISTLKYFSSVAAAMYRLVSLEVRRGVFKIKSSVLAVSCAKI